MKESVTKFDLEAAFKELNSFEIPKAEKGIRANRNDLSEAFEGAKAKKLKIETLVEDYYNINSTEDLEQANADREAEIAKAKLARIEKIVDLEAESEEDLLPNYVGKIIVQCPQCMTLFYKDKADIVESEETPETVNVGELCQHCGNESGYTVIGKVGTVEDADTADDPESKIDLAAEEVPEDEENTEEIESDEETVEETEETTDEEDLNLDLVDIEDEPTEEQEEVKESLALNEDVEDENEEAIEDAEDENDVEEIILTDKDVKDIAEDAAETVLEASEEGTLEDIKEITDKVVETHLESAAEEEAPVDEVVAEEEVEESLTEADSGKVNVKCEAVGEIITVNRKDLKLAHKLDAEACKIYDIESAKDEFNEIEDELCTKYGIDSFSGVEIFEALAEKEGLEWEIAYIDNASDLLTEAVDKELDAKLKAHNEYIEYLKDMIEKEEKSLATAKNDFVKKSIQSRIDALKADLESALPEALKDEIETELPTAEEVELEATKNVEEPKDELAEVKENTELKESLNLEEDTDNLDISDEEFEELIQEFKNESVDSKKAIAISDLDIEELDDEALEKAISEALDIDDFKLTECYVKNNSLVILGNIEKNNVKCFTFNEAFVEDNNVTLAGLVENSTIKLTGKISSTKNLITESFLIN